jgi:hypothetical protein
VRAYAEASPENQVNVTALRYPPEVTPTRTVFVTVLSLFVVQCLSAQTAQLAGIITDQQGDAIPAVTVTATNTANSFQRRAQSNESGSYSLPALPPGTYTLVVEKAGFQNERRESIKLDTAQNARLDMQMRIAQVDTTVSVVAGTEGVAAVNSPVISTVIARQVTENLPLNGRSYADLALLVPGVRKSSLNRGEGTFLRESSMNVNGLPSAFNNFVMDGVDNNSYGTSNRGFSNQVSQPSPDAVEEFSVQTSSMSAEYGRAVGATVAATLRSGTNAFHGSAYEYLRNTQLNAIGFFKPLQGRKPTLNRNQFGVTLGGPMRKDRTFFFVDYEAVRNRSKTLAFYSVPTLAMRSGDLGVPVRHPLTGEMFNDGRIPARAQSAFAAYALQLYPEPNLPGLANNWETLNYVKDDLDKGDAKVDHRFSDKLFVFARFSAYKRFVLSPIYPRVEGDPGEGRNYMLNQQGVLSATYVVNASSVLEAKYGYSRTRAGKAPLQIGSENIAQRFGIPGLPQDDELVGGLHTQSITGLSGLGRQSTNPQYQDPAVATPKLTYSLVRGRHNLKFGYEYQRIDTTVQDLNPLYGVDTYAGQFSRPTGGTGQAAVYNVADFFFGARSRYAMTNYQVVNIRQRMHFGFVQDDYKITRNLTLNVGMRYEFATPQFERDNIVSNFDLNSLQLTIAKDGSLRDRTQVSLDRNNVAPRLGFAWSARPRTVIRGGYGISYIHYFRRGGTMPVYNAPIVVRSSIDQTPAMSSFLTTTQGYPAGFTARDRFDPLRTTILYFDRSGVTPYVQNWTLAIQQQLPRGWVGEVAYVGNHGIKIPTGGDWNQPAANLPGGSLAQQARRPLQNFAEISVNLPIGTSEYHALQTKVERRFRGGLAFLNAFTWSVAMDNYCGFMEAPNNCGVQGWLNNLRGEWARSAFDQPLTNVTSVVWRLPVGKGERLLPRLHPVGQAAIGGWRLSLINTMQSGETVNLVYSPTPAFSRGVTQRPNIVGSLYPATQTINNYFDPAGVAVPTDVTQPFGNAGRNIGRSNPLYETDLGLHKTFPFGERIKLEFRGEAFNLLNKTNFRAAQANRTNVDFGSIRSTYTPRRFQLALRLAW